MQMMKGVDGDVEILYYTVWDSSDELLRVLYTYFEAVLRHGTMESTKFSTHQMADSDQRCFPFEESF